MSIRILSFVLLFTFALSSYAQKVERVEPPFWWAGMLNPELQLMVHGDNIAELQVTLENANGVELRQVTKMQSPNYLIIDLRLAEDVKAGDFVIQFKSEDRSVYEYTYSLRERAAESAQRAGFDPSDVMYLITPDRFANGNPANDELAGLKEKANRSFKGGRHGGDIKGILDNLDYIKDMGFTAIWVNPVLENDMEEYSYHGYSTTDFYKVDARFGSNEEYQELGRRAKEMGIKLIMDMIVNHSGSEHWWLKDLPSSDWVNYQEEYKQGQYQITTHRKAVTQDPYGSEVDRQEFTDGWFVTTMPDLNQRHPIMSKYLIQNTIWWIEYADLAGIRMDTYPYPDMDFMSQWTCEVMAEYPNFNIVGEEWHGNPAIVAYWQAGKENPNGYTSCLPSLMDFPLQEQVTRGLVVKEEDFRGWVHTYEMLATDFLYADPYNLVVFPDNHDMSRFYTQVEENFALFKLGITYFLTVRGIPQIYYGTEILMSDRSQGDHGIIRSDFPGGWAGDEVNGFTGEGLTDQQKEAQAFMRKLLNWRKGNQVIHQGKLMHYNPKDGIYVLFRYTDTSKVMIILSKNPAPVSLELSRFHEMLAGHNQGKEIITGRSLSMNGTIEVPAMSPMIIELP